MSAPRIFDGKHYQSHNRARETAVRKTLSGLSGKMSFCTALDVGCGVGHFSTFLHSMGLQVTGVDGRPENVEEAARRAPQVSFHMRSVEDPNFPEIGRFDLVLCLGLLYHLENPFRAVRNLYSLTGKILIIESMCAPGADPCMQLLDEYEGEDQGLNLVAFYPTESCLVKMLYRAGFPFVHRISALPEHEDFCATRARRKARTMLVASQDKLDANGLELLREPKRDWDLWAIPASPWTIRLARLIGLLRKPKPRTQAQTQESEKLSRR